MWLMLQQDKPEDFVIATGITTSVRDFARRAFKALGINLIFEGEGINEIARVESCDNPDYQVPTGKIVVEIDPAYYRPTEVELLIGDPSKAMKKLGWELKYSLSSLVDDMVTADLALFKRDYYLQRGGHPILNNQE